MASGAIAKEFKGAGAGAEAGAEAEAEAAVRGWPRRGNRIYIYCLIQANWMPLRAVLDGA